MFKVAHVFLFGLICTVGLTGCDDDNNNLLSPTVLEGQFIDSPVIGMSYITDTGSAVTNSNGLFEYLEGETVTFLLGDIIIGSAEAKATVTPVDFVASATNETDVIVSNIARFIQTLDDDNNLDNGITITDAVDAAALGDTINFAQPSADFETDTNVLAVVAELTALTTAGTRNLKTAAEAQTHLRDSLLALYAGTWVGTFSGGDQGSYTVSVNDSGMISGTGSSSVTSDTFSIAGSISSSGIADFAATPTGSTSTSATFVGQANAIAGSATGTWNNTDAMLNGSWSASRQ